MQAFMPLLSKGAKDGSTPRWAYQCVLHYYRTCAAFVTFSYVNNCQTQVCETQCSQNRLDQKHTSKHCHGHTEGLCFRPTHSTVHTLVSHVLSSYSFICKLSVNIRRTMPLQASSQCVSHIRCMCKKQHKQDLVLLPC